MKLWLKAYMHNMFEKLFCMRNESRLNLSGKLSKAICMISYQANADIERMVDKTKIYIIDSG